MSTIKATFDIDTREWSLSKAFITADYIDLQINLNFLVEETAFNNLRVGYRLTRDTEMVSQGVYPHAGAITTAKTTPLINERILVASNAGYTLLVWAENFGERIDSTFNFITPMPAQPFPSWTWDNNQWNAPTPMPTDGPADAAYKWSEKQQQWFLLVPPLHDFDDI
jgi:hypothetical protein